MDYNILQILLIFLITFIAAIDQFSFLESLYQPIVTGMVVGLIISIFQTVTQIQESTLTFVPKIIICNAR